MSAPLPFRIELQHEDGWVCLVLEGDLDANGAPELNAVAWPLLGRYDGDQIVLDCAGLDDLDEAGATELLRLSRALGPAERPVLRNLAPGLAKRITDVDEHFQRELDLTDSPVRSA